MPAEAHSPRPPSTLPLVLLLTAILFISYIDRGNLATAAPLLKAELGLDAGRFGLLMSAFYWTYVACMVPAGWACERFGPHRVLTAGAALWALATLLTGLAGGVLSLLLLRLLLGVGESVVFPASSSLIARYVPPARIGLANGAISFGYLVGPAVGTFVGGLMMERVGWRPVFILFGAVSLLWLWPWARFMANLRASAPATPVAARSAGPGFRRVLRERDLWGTSLGHFAANYNWYFILAFLPLYLVENRGFSMAEMAQVAGGSYLVNAVCAALAGWYLDRWVGSGRPPTGIYKASMVSSHVVSIATMLGMLLLPVRESIACLFVYQVFLGICSPGTYAIGQMLAGPTATGRWIGVQNFCGNVAGIIAPALTGLLVAASGDYVLAFSIAALVNLLGIVGWGVILQKVEPIDWSAPARTA
jgi:MFS family permease